jgi:hypothetical protein
MIVGVFVCVYRSSFVECVWISYHCIEDREKKKKEEAERGASSSNSTSERSATAF